MNDNRVTRWYSNPQRHLAAAFPNLRRSAPRATGPGGFAYPREVTMTQAIVVTDTSTRAELEQALTNYAQHARRQMHHLDCAAWNKAHAAIDAMLSDWEAASA